MIKTRKKTVRGRLYFLVAEVKKLLYNAKASDDCVVLLQIQGTGINDCSCVNEIYGYLD